MFTDEQRNKVWDEVREHGIRAFARQLTPATFAAAAERSGIQVGGSPLNVVNLVWLGISAALNVTKDFAAILTMTVKLLEDQQGFNETSVGRAVANGRRREKSNRNKNRNRSKHSPKREDPTRVSEEAFVKARSRMPLQFWVNLIVVLGEKFHTQHPELHMFRGFRLLAMDGTDVNLPNWEELKKHFGTANNKTGQHNAKARMLMLQFPTTRLPYCYELTGMSEGENSVARRLAKRLCAKDLVLMDAGFWSYGLLCDIQAQQAFFALRLKKGIGLGHIKNLGKGDALVRWTPKDTRKRWAKEGLPKSLELRVVSYQVPGFRPQRLVTNVLNPNEISHADWTRLTTDCTHNGELKPGLFHRRWEIETTFRELKVEQELKNHLRGRKPQTIQYEVAGHVVLYMLTRWIMVEAAIAHGVDPLSISFKHALRELLQVWESIATATKTWSQTLLERLLKRIVEHQVPHRPGRHFKRKKQSTNHKRHNSMTPQSANKKTKKTINKTRSPKKQG